MSQPCAPLISYAVSFGSSVWYGSSYTGNVTLYNVTCSDQSKELVQDCYYDIVSGNETSVYEELIVGCYEKSTCTEEGDIRLMDGDHTMEGRVEVCSQGVWRTIRYSFISGWGRTISKVVCRQLGYPWERELHTL